MSLYDTRNGLKTQATNATSGSLVLVAGRIKLGYHELEEDSTFLKTLAADGPFLLIRAGGVKSVDTQSGIRTVEIPCDLWIGIQRNSDETFQLIEGLLEKIIDAWNLSPHSADVTFDPPEIDDKKAVMPVHYRLSVEKLVGCED